MPFGNIQAGETANKSPLRAFLSRHWTTTFVLVLGILSSLVTYAIYYINETRSNQYLLTDAAHESQIELARAHFLIKRGIEEKAPIDREKVWARFNEARAFIDAMLYGSGSFHGHVVLPLTDPELIEQVGVLRSRLLAYGDEAGRALVDTSDRRRTRRLDAIFNEFILGAYALDDRFDKVMEQNNHRSRRLLWIIIVAWSAIVVVSLIALRVRELQRLRAEDAIIASKREWERTFDTVPDLIMIIDREFRVRRINAAMAGRLGLRPSEAVGMRCHELVHEGGEPLALCPHRMLLADQQEHSVQVYEKRLGGHFLVTVSPLRDAAGTLIGSVHVARDISEQIRTSENLKIKDSAIESSINAIVITDLGGTITYVNPAFLMMWGYGSARDIAGRPVECLAADPETAGTVMRAVASEGGWIGETAALRKDGTVFAAELSASIVKDDAGRPLCLMASIIDITDRKKAEDILRNEHERLESLVQERTAELTAVNEGLMASVTEHQRMSRALLESENKFRNLSREFNVLLDAMPDGLLLMSPDLTILWANREAMRDFGTAGASLEGRRCYEVIHTQDQACEECPALRALQSGVAESSQVTSRTGRLWALRAFPIKDDNGAVTAVMELSTDITDKVSAQAERIRTAHLASLGELAAGVAHEINNPVNGIINYAQMIANRHAADSKEHEIAGRIIREGGRVAAIVRSLLSFARDRKEDKVPSSVSQILEESFALTGVQLEKSAVKVLTKVPPDLPPIMANPRQIQQVFMNVINNARYALNQRYPASDDDKVLEVRAETVPLDGVTRVQVTFHDHGIGIPASFRDKVMQPFFTTKPAGLGTGLGLSISHGIIGDHGGHMRIESLEGRYTDVIIDIPAFEGERS